MPRDYTPRPKPEKQPKKSSSGLKRTPIKKKRVKPEKNLMTVFVEIWTTRLPAQQFTPRTYDSLDEWFEHVWRYRVCAITYKPIDTFSVWNYAHVLTRNFTKLREKKENIGMLSADAHKCYDTSTRAKLLEMGPGAKYWLEYHDVLKSNYYQLDLFKDEST